MKKEVFENITIYQGNCFDILPELPKIDMFLTDPPYQFESSGGGFYGNWHGKGNEPRTYISELSSINCSEFDPEELLVAVKKNQSLFKGYFFCNKKLILPYLKFAEDQGYMYDVLTMYKTNPIPACNAHHLNDLEYIIMMREKGTTYQKQKKFADNSKMFTTRSKQDNLHPAQKPLELFERLITSLTIEDEVVCDPFLGSGTCALAAIQTKRKFVGIELEDKYFDMACRRIEKILNTSLTNFFS